MFFALFDPSSLLVIRLPAIILVGIMLVFLAVVTARYWGWLASGSAVAFMVFNPRVLAYLPRNLHDVTVMVTAFLAALAIWRAWHWKGYYLAAFCTALLFASKINAFIIVAFILVWAVIYRPFGQVLRLILALLAGFAGYILAEPMFWYDRWGALQEMFTYHLQHESFRLQLLGTLYEDGSGVILYPLVTFLLSLPIAYMLFFFLGAVTRNPRQELAERSLLGLALLQVVGNLCVAMLPGIPKYAGIRLFFCIYPFAALLAGYGVALVWQLWRRSKIVWLFLLILVLAPVIDLIELHPYEILFTSGLVGGPEGAYKWGFETEGEMTHLTPQILNDAASRLPYGARLVVSPAGPHMLKIYRRLGIPEPYREFTYTPRPGDGLLVYLGHNLNDDLRELIRERQPRHIYSWHNIPLVNFYQVGTPQ